MWIYVGNKEIHAANFIQMGLAEVCHPGVVQLSKYGSNWKFVSNEKLKQMYVHIQEMLVNNEYGEYFAMQEVFGEEVVKEMAQQGQVISPKKVK
jgi:hypothetical protein